MGVARPSRPPGFDMTYRPTESSFGPPFRSWLPPLLYLIAAIAVLVFVLVGEHSPPGSWLYSYVVIKDEHRVIGARTLAVIMFASAIASLVRANMRGVQVRGDGVVYRDVLALGWPRVRRFKWAQIDCIVLDQPGSIALDLWDGSRVFAVCWNGVYYGSRAFLPKVGDPAALSAVLEKVGAARAIPVRGGVGLDEIPESGEFEGDAEA